jgi:hypothetical protein
VAVLEHEFQMGRLDLIVAFSLGEHRRPTLSKLFLEQFVALLIERDFFPTYSQLRLGHSQLHMCRRQSTRGKCCNLQS